MKNILVLEPSGKLYGSEMVLLDIIKNCNSKKYNFTIIIPSNSSFNKLLIDNGFKTKTILNINSSFSKALSYAKIIIAIIKNKPDLMFVNQAGIQKISSLIGLIFSIPIVCEVSTLEDGLLVNKFNPILYKPVKSFICNSEFISSNIKVPNIQKSILYYGYEWKNLNINRNHSNKSFKIALLGRISESKGHFLLVEAMKLISNRENNIKIYFIGDAPNKETLRNIKKLITDYNLEKHFIFRGFQTNIAKELDNMNMMVIPSINEPFGRIFCETAEAKLPCIVADTGGLGELSKRFNLGIRFNGSDALDLSEKIIYCDKNYEKIVNEFDINAHLFLYRLNKKSYINSIENIFDEAIKNNYVNLKWLGNQS